MTGDMNRFLRFICIMHGREVDQCAKLLACTRETVVRYARIARKLGVVMRPGNRRGLGYQVEDYGPFDVHKLRAVKFDPLPAVRPRRAAGHGYVPPRYRGRKPRPESRMIVHAMAGD